MREALRRQGNSSLILGMLTEIAEPLLLGLQIGIEQHWLNEIIQKMYSDTQVSGT